ncbi:Putative nuclease HARBI1 [Trachymyrmex cornetzi]|uniref:Putative nuclease HARBI1 n=1 Tax=Trachymyrmex cornetzi TaxID=471704 RepID=A0A151JLS3_9HYME|nr:Putative nuclease HARBI1 [Trachymyrmex cornetzi]
MDAEQRQLFLLLCSGLLCYAKLSLLRKKTRKRRWWIRSLNNYEKHRNVGFHMNLFKEIRQTDHEQFFMYTRMWPHMFNELLTRVRPFLEKSGPRRPHSVQLKLALTLSFLAHGDSVNSKAWEFRIGRSTVYAIIHEVCRALWQALQPIVLPELDELKWSEVAEDFFEKWQFPNCVGALDGKHIRIEAPTHSGSQFFNYKKYFSIVLLAICDANHKFVWVDIGQCGGISDSGVWSNTELAARVREKLLCDRFTKMVVNYINSSPKRLAVFREFCECFEGKTLKLLKLSDTRWLSHHACVERLIKYWDTIKNFFQEAVVSEKTKSAENLLSIMNNVETKAYFLFLEYVLNFFNQFNAYFQASQTRIHVLQTKYPNLTNLLNAIQSLPNSNADPERMFSLLSNIKNKKCNKLSSTSVNASCVFKSALNAREETCLNMIIDEKHLSLMSTENLYASAAKKDKSTLRLYAADVNDVAGLLWAN